jgi:polar amino acid transport system permease protein
MNYTFQYGQVIDRLPYLLEGALVSLQIAFLTFWGGALIGLFGALGKTSGGRWTRGIVNGYVVFFTNTPALVQIYFLFYALPDFGILLSPMTAVLIGLTLNAGAYLTEIQRAGFASVRRAEIEAAETLGMSRLQSLRYVIVPHIAKTIFAPLSNFFIWMVLGSSIAAVFGVEELTGRAINVSTSNMRTIEVFTTTAAIYVALTIFASAFLALVGRYQFRVKVKVF